MLRSKRYLQLCAQSALQLSIPLEFDWDSPAISHMRSQERQLALLDLLAVSD